MCIKQPPYAICFASVLLTLGAVLSCTPSVADDGQNVTTADDPARLAMRAKLSYSQAVLHGLVTEDFDRIGQNARQMLKMSAAAQWPSSGDKVYRHLSEDFRRQCEKLAALAKARNLEGAHYTYLSLTTSCIHCHNYVRGKFRIDRDSTNSSGPVQLIPTN